MKRLLLLFTLLFISTLSFSKSNFSASDYVSELPKCSGSYWNNCFGKWTWDDGDSTNSEWKNDKAHGIGLYIFGPGEYDRDVFFGEYEKDFRTGQGVYIFGPRVDGLIHAGEWRNNDLNGLGIKILQDGSIKQGIFKNGEYQTYKKYVPKNAVIKGDSWVCKAGYDKFEKYICLKSNLKTSTSTALKIPLNAHAAGTSWECNDGFQKSANKCKLIIPDNAYPRGMSWTCEENYYRNNTETACLKVPKNASSKRTSNVFSCNTGFKKSGNKCIPKIVIPANAKASGSSFTCNNGYYKNNPKTLCLRVPANAKKTSNDLAYACNTGYKTSGNKCIPKIVIPANAKASGSSFTCNSGYYKNSSTTSCLKVPDYAKKFSNDIGWSCNSGFTKTGNTCINIAELKRTQEAKKIAEAKAAKVLKANQIEAQNYFTDLEAFLNFNSKEFDTRRILELRMQNKVILTQPWDKILEENFAELKSFTSTSRAFRNFHQLRNDARQRVVLNELNKASARLKNIESYLNYFLENNLTSDIALDVLDQIDIAVAVSLKTQNLDELSKVSAQLESFIAKNKLVNDFKAFTKALDEEKAQADLEAEEAKTQEAEILAKEATALVKEAEEIRINEEAIEQKLPANAVILGSSWSCNAGFTKTGKTCTKTEELERIKKAKKIAEDKASKVHIKEQLAAQNYYADIVAFLKTNNSEFDITTIVTLMSKNKAILNESWNKVIEKNFAELKSFTASSIAFRDYHQLQNDIRQKVILNELDKANTRLKNINAYLINYVQNNITSNIAQDVLKQINMAKDGLQQQGLNELSRVSTLLEQFIADNQLSNEYLLFAESLAKNNPDDPEVSAKKIDSTDLVEFDFMKKAILSDFIVLINLSGKAPHALLDLEGNTVFENDKALSCFYQSKNTIKKDLKYYLYDKISGKEFLVKDKGFECNQNNLLSYDLIFFEKGTLLKESESYVTSLTSAIANSELQFYKIITQEDQDKDFAQRQIRTINIIEGIEDEMILGFGSLIINNDNTTLCTDVDNTLGQRSIMNLLSNEFTRMGYGKSVEKVSFNNVEDTFANVQRGRCGFIYAGEETLANLLNAFKSSGTKYDVLPIWYSKKMVKNEQLRQEGKEQSDLINKQKIKEQIEKDQKLADLRAEADGVAKKDEQKRLRKLNRNIVKSHVQFVSKEAKLWLDDDSENTGEMLILYPSLVKFMNKKLKERWELDSFEVIINDYGLSNFRNRIIETFITDIKFTLKNNDLGEYEDFCTRIAILDDKEFDRLREPEAVSCQPGELKSYKLKFDFQSSWVVQ